MGYQESWFYMEPQRKFDKLIRAYERAESAGLFGDALHCRARICVIPVEEVLEPGDVRLEGIDLDSAVPTENDYMRRYSVQNYAHRMRTGRVR